MSLNRRLTIAGLAAAALAVPMTVPMTAMAAPAPPLAGKDLNGVDINLAQFKGKTVVIEWVNEGCPYVQKHYNAGAMQATQAAARADGAVWIQVVSSAPGEQGYFANPNAAKAWLTKQKSAPNHMILDPNGTIGKAYKATTTPEMFVVDKTGQLVYRGGIDNRPSANPSSLNGATNYVRAALADIKAGKPVKTAYAQTYGCNVKYKS